MTRILIVDDNEENLAYLQSLLTSSDCTVESVRNGAEALLEARRALPDLVISDLLMPVMDGYALLRQWKADARLSAIPFIVYTATYTDVEDERLARSLGADAFILKPSEPEQFLAQLGEVQARVASTRPVPLPSTVEHETAQLRLYNATLVRKLEEKTLQLEAANRTLREDIAARIRSEQAAERALQRLNEAQHIGKIGDWEWDPVAASIVWSAQVFEIFGRDPVLGPPRDYDEYRSFFDDENRPLLEAGVAAAFATGEAQDHELTLARENGVRIWVHGVVVPRKDETGRVVSLHGTVQDITAARQVREALSSAEKRYRDLFEHMLEGYASCRAIFDGGRLVDFVYLEVNRAFEVITGLHGVVGKKVSELIPGAFMRSHEIVELYERAVLTGVPERREVFMETPGVWLSLAVYSSDREHFVVVFDNITERKRTEEALRRSEALFRTLVQSSWDGFHLIDPSGKIVYESPAVTRLLGYRPEEMVGHGAIDFVHPDDVAKVVGGVNVLGQPGALRTVTLRVRHKDGSWRHVESFEVNLLEHRDVGALAVNYRDITARVAAEAVASRLASLVESSADAIVGEDTSSNITSWNRGAENVFGYTEREMLGTSITRLIPAERQHAAQDIRLNLLHGEGVRHFEMPRLTKAGKLIHVAVTASPIRDAEGTIVGISEVARDITARKTAEAAAANLLTVIEASLNEIYIVDATTLRFDYVNECAQRNLGYETQRLRSQTLLDLQPEFTPESFGELVAPLRSRAAPKIVVETVHLRADGSCYPVEVHLQLVEQGAKPVFLAVVNDTSERRRAELALRESEAEFRALAEAIPQMVWIVGADGACLYQNRQWVEYTGQMTHASGALCWDAALHADDRERVGVAWKAAFAAGNLFSVECRFRRVDGVHRWWLVRGVPQRGAVGTISKWFGTCTDIHDLKLAESEISRANRALKMLSTCNEALIRAEVEQELLERTCRIAVDTGGYRMAWVGYPQDDEARSIKPVAHAGTEDGYLTEIKTSWNEHDPLGQGPAGQVIRSGETVVCADLMNDPTFKSWRAPALRRGYRGVILLPLRERQHTFGFLGLYSADVDEPGADELGLFRQLADDLAFGIVHLRARLVQQRLQTAVLKVGVAVSATTGDAFYEQLARNMAEALGAYAAYVCQLNAGEPASASTLAAVLDGKAVANFDYVMEGTPCEVLKTSASFVVARDVAEQFPRSANLAALDAQAYAGCQLNGSTGQPLGHLVVIFREPLVDTAFVMSTMQIFAARAASELERAQIDLQMREQAALIDESRDAIVVRDLDHRITFWSKGAERVYGRSASEARGTLIQKLLATDVTTFAEADRMVRETGEWNGEIRSEARNAAALTLSARWTLLRNAGGEPRSILSIDTDITEQKKIEAHFLRTQRMESIGTLAGGIAHDLNNVFGPITLSLELLSLNSPDPASAELISILRSSAQHGADMVRQLLTFARGVEGQRIELQLRDLVGEIEKIANDTFLKQIQVRTIVPRDLWRVVGDPTQIHQVLLNLCVNARDAMPNGGTLTVSIENCQLDAHHAARNPDAKPGPHVLLQVGDTGTGMSPAIVEKIFDPFFTTKEVGKGTGLGLSTSLAIVKSHGGFVRVSSEPGKGTTFEVYLPAQAAAPHEAAAKAAAELPRGRGELILVVDDEASIRAITKATLERFGYRTLLASDGAQGVALYETRHDEIAAVLTDMTMPVMDGPTAVGHMRRIDPAVRVIAMSGLAISGEAARARARGLDVQHFIPKPYTAETLLMALRQTLDG